MASLNVITQKCAHFLIDKLHSGEFDQDLIDMMEDEMTGAEINNREYVEDIMGEVYIELERRLQRS